MKISIIFLTALGLIEALSLTYRMKANEEPCFLTDIINPNSRIQLYFSATDVRNEGNAFVNIIFRDSKNNAIHSMEKQTSAELNLAPPVGTVSICFSHYDAPGNGKTDMNIDIDYSLVKADGTPYLPGQNEVASESGAAVQANVMDADTTKLDKIVIKLHKDLGDLNHNLKYMKVRIRRNKEVVETIEFRIFWFSVIESAMILGMSILQVVILRKFFSSPSRPRY